MLADLARGWAAISASLTGADGLRTAVRRGPVYAGLTLDEIGGRGVRWPERDAAARLAPAERRARAVPLPTLHDPPAVTVPTGAAPGHLPLDLGRARGPPPRRR